MEALDTSAPPRTQAAQESSAEAEAARVPLTYWQLVIRRFRKHHLAVVSLFVLVVMLVVCVVLAEFFAPYGLTTYSETNISAPPQWPQFVDEQGEWHLRPFVYGWQMDLDPLTGQRSYTIDTAAKFPIYLFTSGEPYQLWGLIESDLHLFGVREGAFYLLGGDKLGRDLFSRIIFGGRVSLTIGVLGVAITMVLGTVLGTLSGYYGGVADTFIQRSVEVLLSIPAIPLWMSLTAAFPPEWSSIKVYFAITTVLGLIGWGSVARQVRGLVISLREQEFIQATQALGGGDTRIILFHLIPNVANHLIVLATLSIPWLILSETALSFLGLGIRPPLTSWGVLLEEAQNVQVIRHQPWLIFPVLAVILTVLIYNFIGDGLRDAIDPRAT